MELNSREVLEVLKSKGIDTLHHANTVQTSCLFLQHGRILSRGTVEERGLEQTAQKSDDLDKRFGIWNDLFLDSVDIHERAKSRNFYGPVLFRFKLDLLSEDWLPSIWVTKKNPTEWQTGEPATDRYYSSVEEFKSGYKKGDFGSMFMLRNAGGVLRLAPHLKDILLDDPNWEYQDNDVYSQTVGALLASAWQGGIKDIDIHKRKCLSGCKCIGQYTDFLESEETKKKYGPRTAKLFFFMAADS
ncbi:hypothetical protein [Variovorax sp.]|jgi:hypothetical protein|uniref:hypothetical protein n=1 Tax=Variovorax sp. TaxID=1871043 RepID=UPI004038067A